MKVTVTITASTQKVNTQWYDVLNCIIYHVPPEWETASQRTAFNRSMVQDKMFVKGYIEIEQALKANHGRIPDWIPLGRIPGGR
jgi:hypothetical protein